MSMLQDIRLWWVNRHDVKRLRSRIAFLEGVIKDDLSDEVLLKELNYQEGTINMRVEPPRLAAMYLMRLMALFIHKAENFNTAEFTMGNRRFELTVRHLIGMTPAEKIGIMMSALAAVLAERANQAGDVIAKSGTPVADALVVMSESGCAELYEMEKYGPDVVAGKLLPIRE